MLFDDDYKIWRCVSLPCEVIKERAKYRKHVNGFVARATDELLRHPSVTDYSDQLRESGGGPLMDTPGDWTHSSNCRVCDRESVPGSYLCSVCRGLRDRTENRKDVSGKGRKIDKAARRRALLHQWDPDIGGFRCYYADVKLTHDYGSRRYATWEHREPGDESSVVLVAHLVNKMKGDMKEAEFKAMVRALSRRFEDQPFDESAFPPDPTPGSEPFRSP